MAVIAWGPSSGADAVPQIDDVSRADTVAARLAPSEVDGCDGPGMVPSGTTAATLEFAASAACAAGLATKVIVPGTAVVATTRAPMDRARETSLPWAPLTKLAWSDPAGADLRKTMTLLPADVLWLVAPTAAPAKGTAEMVVAHASAVVAIRIPARRRCIEHPALSRHAWPFDEHTPVTPPMLVQSDRCMAAAFRERERSPSDR